MISGHGNTGADAGARTPGEGGVRVLESVQSQGRRLSDVRKSSALWLVGHVYGGSGICSPHFLDTHQPVVQPALCLTRRGRCSFIECSSLLSARFVIVALLHRLKKIPRAVHRWREMMKPQVVFVLGGPGAGKGTQCARIVAVREMQR